MNSLFRAIAIFHDLTDQELSLFVSRCAVRWHEPHATIIREQDESRDVFLVLQGAVRVNCVSAGGREVTFNELQAGSIFGEFSAVDGLPRSATVTTIEKSLIARMSSENFAGMLKENGRVSYVLVRLLVEKVRDLSGRMFEVSALGVRERVRKELVRLAALGEQRAGIIIVKPAPTHYDLAARIGSHREAITRELNRLAQLGIIKLRRQEITILDLRRLETAADE